MNGILFTRLLAAALLAITSQLVLGTLLVSLVSRLLARVGARRRWLVSWATAARGLRRTARWALGALAGSLGLVALTCPSIQVGIRAIWARPIWFVVLGALPAACCLMMLHAGREEALGRLGRARREARLGGQLMFVGTLALSILVWGGLVLEVPLRRALITDSHMAGVVMIGALLSLGCAGFVAVAGGLAGKPRPSSYFVCAFHLGGVGGLITAFQMTL